MHFFKLYFVCSILIVFSLLLCLCSTSAVAANSSFDINEKGNVSISLRYNSQVVSGGSLSAYKVADVDFSDGNLSFKLTSKFAKSNVKLNNVSDSVLADTLENYAKSHSISSKTNVISKSGNVVFNELDAGLYLFTQKTPAKGYNAVKPFLVSVPMYSNGEYLYHIDASPKVQISKVQEEPTLPYVDPKPKEQLLPKTGLLKWPIPVGIVAGLLLLILGWKLRFGRKSREFHHAE